MPFLLCPNPNCVWFTPDPSKTHCPRCRHPLLKGCPRCEREIRVATDQFCWACADPYKLPEPLPEEKLGPAA